MTTGVLSAFRRARVAIPLLIAVPVPLAAALVLTGQAPVYPEDACYYGAPRASLAATEEYLGLMTALAMSGLAVIAWVALPMRGRWRFLAPAVTVWAVASLFAADAARAVVVFGGNMVVFGLILAIPFVVIMVLGGREYSWTRAIGWFEFLFRSRCSSGWRGCWPSPAITRGDAGTNISMTKCFRSA